MGGLFIPLGMTEFAIQLGVFGQPHTRVNYLVPLSFDMTCIGVYRKTHTCKSKHP